MTKQPKIKEAGNQVEYYDRFTAKYTEQVVDKAEVLRLIDSVDILIVDLCINHYDYTAFIVDGVVMAE